MAAFTSAGLFFASIENGCVKFLRFEFNRRIAAAGVSQSLV
jgi:hypothetical protein